MNIHTTTGSTTGIQHQTSRVYLDTTQAADWLKLSRSTLAKMRVSGDGPPYYKLGKKVVYALQDLEEWVSLRRMLNTSHKSIGELA